MDTVTSTTLLQRLGDANDTTAWQRFTHRYRPMIVSYARKQGLSATDAEDVGQETLTVFLKGNGNGGYDPSKGRLRNWLFRVAYNKAVDVLRRRARENVATARSDGTAILKSVPSEETAETLWEAEWRRFVVRACIEEVRTMVSPQAFAAFDLYVLEQWPVDRVAEYLGKSTGAVHTAKHRVMNKIRELLPDMEEIW